MLHTVEHPYSTTAPAIISIVVPAATRGRLASSDLDLRQHVLIVIDDNIRLRGEKDDRPFSEMAEDLFREHGIPAVKMPINFDRLRFAHKTGDNGGIIDAVTDIFSAFIGNRHIGLLVPVERAEQAIRLLASPEKVKQIEGCTALSYRGSARSLFPGPQCAMSPESVFLPKELADNVVRDLAMLQQFRDDHQQRQQRM
ncbi:MAG: hypothetical protein KGJ06_04805 [Pseudomonadota bacterium]|nr:hypothetical protein [Pseudomonadota bacterium]